MFSPERASVDICGHGSAMKAGPAMPASGPPSEQLFAAVHVPELSIQAALRFRPALRTLCVAVLAGPPSLDRVCAANTAARRDGLRPGMTRAEAESFPGITLLRRSVREERAAQGALLSCVGNFSPAVETCHTATAAICVLDASSLNQFYPDAHSFAGALRRAVLNRGLEASIAVCGNFEAARVLAQGKPGITVVRPGEERKALAPLLLDVLDAGEEQERILDLWGIRTLSGLAALPEKELIARMGQAGKRLQELARGEHAHQFAPSFVPWTLREELTFDAPVSQLDEISAAVSPMLEQLIRQARDQSLALASVSITLQLSWEFPEIENGRMDSPIRLRLVAKAESETVEPIPAREAGHAFLLPDFGFRDAESEHRRTVHLPSPTNNLLLLVNLLKFELASNPPVAPVTAVTLEATAAKPGSSGKDRMHPRGRSGS